jgi:hypothetical protein
MLGVSGALMNVGRKGTMLARRYAKGQYCIIDGIQLLERDVKYGFCSNHDKQEIANYYVKRFIGSKYGRYRLNQDDLYRFGRSAMSGQIGTVIWWVEKDNCLYWHERRKICSERFNKTQSKSRKY